MSKRSIFLIVVLIAAYAVYYYHDPLRSIDACVRHYETDVNRQQIKGSCGLALYARENHFSADYEKIYQICKRHTLMQLKAPSTAKFGNIAILPALTVKGEGSYSVTYTVDGQNAFGGTVRNYAACMYTTKLKEALVVMDSGENAPSLVEQVMAAATSPLQYEPSDK